MIRLLGEFTYDFQLVNLCINLNSKLKICIHDNWPKKVLTSVSMCENLGNRTDLSRAENCDSSEHN